VAELEAMSGLEPRQIVRALAQPFGLTVMETAEMLSQAPAFDLLPLAQALARHCVLLRAPDGALTGVIADPFDLDLQTWLARRRAPAPPRRCTRAWRCSPTSRPICRSRRNRRARSTRWCPGSATGRRDGKTAAVLSFASVSEAASPAVKLVNSTLYDALKAGASDIHLESTAGGLAVKYRIDGVLDHATSVGGVEVAEHIISRLKVLAELDIAERRVPQDGSFRVESGGREIDLRVSIMPSIHGEDAVIRILDKRAMIEAYGALTLEALGFDAPSLVTLRTLAQEAYGMLLVTGTDRLGQDHHPVRGADRNPQRARKDHHHRRPGRIPAARHPADPGQRKEGPDLRQGPALDPAPRPGQDHGRRDPRPRDRRDRGAVGADRPPGADHRPRQQCVRRVRPLHPHGHRPYAFVSALNGIWAQRLVRMNCPHCAAEYTPGDAELASVNLERKDVHEYLFMRGKGCGDCRGTGYKGRRSIAEILTLNDEIRELIVDKRPIRQIKAAAHDNGTRSLRLAALDLVRRGATTLDEIKRVTLHA
jgi:general secretion pathway protein E